ncbi:CHASE sensor domain-containing protein, partial [Acinetobacter stercoris]|uniref:CHASE sensor domain-containing protein n=1 Tax=Acinetobacter stercoris TaxID=2126983 RepID=UPI002AF6CC27
MMNFFKTRSLQTLFRKSQITIFAITFLICTVTFISISVLTVESYAKQNLQLIGRTIGERIQPALVFKDQMALSQILNEYTHQHSIRKIQVLDSHGEQISHSIKTIEHYSGLQNLFDHFFLQDPVELPIYHRSQLVGQLIVYGSANEIMAFFFKIFVGLAIGMFFMLVALWWTINSTYRHIMQSIFPLMNIAKLVSGQKAYNLRFPKNNIKEFQDLNNVFNELLEEIHVWHNHLQT